MNIRNLKTVKSESDVALSGIKIRFVTEDKTIKAAEFIDGDGNYIKVGFENYSGLRVFVPAEPEKVDRWHLSGKFLGLSPVSEFFEREYDAKDRLSEFDNKSGCEPCGLSIQKVSVELPENAGPVDCDMPF